MAKNRVWVCTKCRNSSCLVAFLNGSHGPKVSKVGCQKICKGPVAGTRLNGQVEWFFRVDRAKPMVALLRAAQHGRKKKQKLPRPLQQRRVTRRSGQLPRG
jgi:hypothetical protein